GDFGRGYGGQQAACADGVDGAVVEMLFGTQEMDVVDGDEGDVQRAAKLLGFTKDAAIAGREMMDGEVEAIGEDFLELCEQGDGERRGKRDSSPRRSARGAQTALRGLRSE